MEVATPTRVQQKILVVEDEPSLLRILLEEFAGAGYRVFGARTGGEGLASAQRERPDLIILDPLMARMEGFAMLQKLRQDAWGRQTPVVMLANAEHEAPKAIQAVDQGVFELTMRTRWSLADLRQRVAEKLDAAERERQAAVAAEASEVPTGRGATARLIRLRRAGSRRRTGGRSR